MNRDVVTSGAAVSLKARVLRRTRLERKVLRWLDRVARERQGPKPSAPTNPTT
jgi:hypothetical protein